MKPNAAALIFAIADAAEYLANPSNERSKQMVAKELADRLSLAADDVQRLLESAEQSTLGELMLVGEAPQQPTEE